jgi:hypothetical protein
MNKINLPCRFVEPKLGLIVITTLRFGLIFSFEDFSCNKQRQQSFARKVACIASQRKNNARKTANVAQKIK